MTSLHFRRIFAGRNSTIVEVRGKLDALNAQALRLWAEENSPHSRVHLDLSRVGPIDAATRAILDA